MIYFVSDARLGEIVFNILRIDNIWEHILFGHMMTKISETNAIFALITFEPGNMICKQRKCFQRLIVCMSVKLPILANHSADLPLHLLKSQ